MSPQPRMCWHLGEFVVSYPWPEARYQFLFYHGNSKSTWINDIRSRQMLETVSLDVQVTRTEPLWTFSQVTWLCHKENEQYLASINITEGLVSLNCNSTLYKRCNIMYAMIDGGLEKVCLFGGILEPLSTDYLAWCRFKFCVTLRRYVIGDVSHLLANMDRGAFDVHFQKF